jgi:hypothetical protein
LLDASAYGSFAATGGNLLASVAAAVSVCLGIFAVETAGAAAMRVRLRAAGRTHSFLGLND